MDWSVSLLRVATSIATITGKTLVSARRGRAERELSLGQLAAARGIGLFSQKRLERQIDQLAEMIFTRLEPLVSVEFRDVPDNERSASMLVVERLISESSLTDRVLLDSDVREAQIHQALEDDLQKEIDGSHLSVDAGELARAVFRESVAHLVEVIITLPSFQGRALQELLSRETEVIDVMRDVVDRMPSRSNDSESAVGQFELMYMREVARKFDQVEIFGITTASSSRRYPLSIAYIGLSLGKTSGSAVTTDDKETPQEVLSTSTRLIVKGEAGSGKTTLLHWLALNCAQGTHAGPIRSWNGKIPFLVQLRRYASEPLPTPRQFISSVSGLMLDRVSSSWASDKLLEGNAVLLIDGVDEFPSDRRLELREWIEELLGSFAHSPIIITSRPGAIADDWPPRGDVEIAELLPMSQDRIWLFITHWHDAIKAELLEEDTSKVEEFKNSLSAAVAQNRPLRLLSSNPLMCALMCALNWDRAAELPRKRVEIYRIALEMLLVRRDSSRAVPSRVDVSFDFDDRLNFLKELAWWFTSSNESEVERSRVEDQVDRTKRSLPDIQESASTIVRYLVLRSGLLREPSPGYIDFIHKTFQEYLAALHYTESDQLNALLSNVDREEFHEVLVMAAGVARPAESNKIVEKILRKIPSRLSTNGSRLILLVATCLDAGNRITPENAEKVKQQVARIVPPANMARARALAGLGDALLELLPTDASGIAAGEAASCVHAAGLIGSTAALRYISNFAHDRRELVHREKTRAWSYFDPAAYARTAFPESPTAWTLKVQDRAVLVGLREISNLKYVSFTTRGDISSQRVAAIPGIELCNSIRVQENTQLRNLSFVRKVKDLSVLEADTCSGLDDVSNLSDSADLRVLRLTRCASSLQRTTLSSLSKLTRLELGLHSPPNLTRILEDCPLLRQMRFSSTSPVASVGDLGASAELRVLEFSSSRGLTAVTGLSELTELRKLELDDCPEVRSLKGLGGAKKLATLHVSYCSQFTDLGAIASVTSLRTLHLEGVPVSDLDFLETLPNLVNLTVVDCPMLEDYQLPADLLSRLNSLKWQPRNY